MTEPQEKIFPLRLLLFHTRYWKPPKIHQLRRLYFNSPPKRLSIIWRECIDPSFQRDMCTIWYFFCYSVVIPVLWTCLEQREYKIFKDLHGSRFPWSVRNESEILRMEWTNEMGMGPEEDWAPMYRSADTLLQNIASSVWWV